MSQINEGEHGLGGVSILPPSSAVIGLMGGVVSQPHNRGDRIRSWLTSGGHFVYLGSSKATPSSRFGVAPGQCSEEAEPLEGSNSGFPHVKHVLLPLNHRP